MGYPIPPISRYLPRCCCRLPLFAGFVLHRQYLPVVKTKIQVHLQLFLRLATLFRPMQSKNRMFTADHLHFAP